MVDALTQDGDEGRGVAAISFGEVPSNPWSEDFRMGKPNRVNRDYSDITSESIPGEVKHLSNRRKKEKIFIPLVAASEKGRA